MAPPEESRPIEIVEPDWAERLGVADVWRRVEELVATALAAAENGGE